MLVFEEAPGSDRAPAVTPVAFLLLAAKPRLVVEVDARALVARMPTSPAFSPRTDASLICAQGVERESADGEACLLMAGAGEEQGTAGDVECREAGEDEREVDAVESEPIEFRAPDTMPLLSPAVREFVSPADWSGCELT